jgi:hypothetical protein
MLAAVVLFLIRVFPWLSWDYRHRRIKRRQICPACANKVKVDIRFDPREKVIVCQCPLCLAAWGYNPAVMVGKWAKPITED